MISTYLQKNCWKAYGKLIRSRPTPDEDEIAFVDDGTCDERNLRCYLSGTEWNRIENGEVEGTRGYLLCFKPFGFIYYMPRFMIHILDTLEGLTDETDLDLTVDFLDILDCGDEPKPLPIGNSSPGKIRKLKRGAKMYHWRLHRVDDIRSFMTGDQIECVLKFLKYCTQAHSDYCSFDHAYSHYWHQSDD